MTHTTNQKDPQGRPHGVWEDYRPDGTLMWRGHWLHGEPHGLSEWYHPDGHLMQRGHYHHGTPHGLWEDYHPDGTTYAKRYHLRIK